MSRPGDFDRSRARAAQGAAAAGWPLLAIDAGNTALKGAFFPSERKRSAGFRLSILSPSGGRAFLSVLRSALESLQARPAAVVVASVRPDLDAAIARAVETSLRVPARFVARDVPVPLAIRVRFPGRVGADRLVDAVAALGLLRRERGAVVVDCGSAITCDAVTSRGEFLGGAIAPGIRLGARALHEFTSQLPLVDALGARSVRALGRDTVEAIRAGLVVGFRGLVAALVRGARRELGGRALVIATGGDAKLLAPEGSRRVPDLALRGIARIHAESSRFASAARR